MPERGGAGVLAGCYFEIIVLIVVIVILIIVVIQMFSVNTSPECSLNTLKPCPGLHLGHTAFPMQFRTSAYREL